MTKTIKKSFIVLLMLVASLFFAVAVGTGFNSASAAEQKTDAQMFIEDVETFKTNVAGTGEFDNPAIRASMLEKENVTLFFKMYLYVSTATEIPAEAASAKVTYTKIYNQYNLEGAVELYAKITSSVYDIYTSVDQTYINSVVEAKSARQNWNTIYTKVNDVTFLKNSDLTFVEEDFITDDSTDPVTTEKRVVPEILVKAENQVKEWEKHINEAIDAIKTIQVVKTLADTATVKVYDDANNKYLDEYVGVLASANSLQAAKDAIDLVIDENNENCLTGSFDGKNHLSVYNKINGEYEAQKKAVDRVVGLIKDALDKFDETEGHEVCYSIHDKIEAARKAYDDDKFTGTVVNDLKGAVASYKEGTTITNYFAKLQGMESAYDDACSKISAVADKINAIGEVKYDGASKKAIAEARKAFDGKDLPWDVRDHDVKEAEKDEPAYWVSKNFGTDPDITTVDYGTLLKAEQALAKYQTEVDNSVKAINDLIKGVSDPNFFSNYNKMYKIVNEDMSDIDNQLYGDSTVGDYKVVGVWATALDKTYKFDDSKIDIVTCKDAYEYCRKFATQISEKTQQISKDIAQILTKEIRFNNEFEKLYSDIVKNIDKLNNDQRYLNAIVGYDSWTNESEDNLGVKQKYEALVALAEDWIDSIVQNVVTVNDFENVEASVVKYNALAAAYVGADEATRKANLAADLAAFDGRKYKVVKGETAVENTYKAWFELYKTGLAKKADIEKAMADLSDAILGNEEGIVGLVRPTLENAAGNAAYATAVAAVKDAYDKLATDFDNGVADTKAYFAEKFEDAFNKYQEALTNVIANAVEEKIALIESDKDVENANRIAEARAFYEKEENAAAKGVDLNEKAFVRNYSVLTDAEKVVNDFITKVNALLVGASFNGKSDVAAEDVDSTATITKENLKNGIYKVNTSVTAALLTAYNGMTAVQKAYAAEVEGKAVSVAASDKLLNDIVSIVSATDLTNTATNGSKIKFIDSALRSYLRSYANNAPSDYTYDELLEYVDALTDSQKGLLEAYDDFKQIKRDKDVADQLKEAIDKLTEKIGDGDDIKITKENVIEYYIINSIYENLNDSQKALLGKDEHGELTATKKLAEIKAKIEAAGNNVVDVVKAIDNIDTKISKLEAAKATLTTNVTNNATAIAAINTTIDGLKDAKVTLDAAIANITKDGGTIDSKVADAKAALEDANEKLEKAYKDADKALQDAIDAANAAIKAETEAREAETKKLHNAIVTISIIFSIVLVALVACVVVLFLKKRA